MVDYCRPGHICYCILYNYYLLQVQWLPHAVELLFVTTEVVTHTVAAQLLFVAHNNGACKHPYWNNFTALIYSLVNSLYKIITSPWNSYFMLRNLTQVAIWLPLPPMYKKRHIVSFFLLFILVKDIPCIPLKYLSSILQPIQ